MREKFLEFARAGGLLISPRGVVAGETKETFFNYQIHRLGKGGWRFPRKPGTTRSCWWPRFSF